MKFDYKIGIFGSVSSGKSTLINSIFAKHLSQMNIRRTTMIPQVYMFESHTNKHEVDDSILNKNKESNDKFKDEIWDGKTMNYHVVDFPPKFLPNNQNLNFYIYDLPGLNDQSTKDLYMKWASDNFQLFDCVILVIDIYSGLNTSDEIDICRLIFKKMSEKRHVNLIILVNKCDDMVYKEGEFHCEEDKELIYNEQIIPTLNKLLQEYHIERKRCNIIKFCSRNAFIYRTIHHNSSTVIRAHLDNKHLHEMMQFEIGRNKWLKLSEQQKEDKINTLIDELHNDVECYENNMIHTGFVKLRTTLSDIVNCPEIVQPFYEKIIFDIIDNDEITEEECFEHAKSIDDLVLEDYIKAHLIQTIVIFYVENFYNHYLFRTKVAGNHKDMVSNNVKIGRWFLDLKKFQAFEDYVVQLKYMEKNLFSQKFFEKLLGVFMEAIEILSEDKLFSKIVDRRIVPSGPRYNLDLSNYLNNLIEVYVKPSHWNDREFFDWVLSHNFKSVPKYIMSFVNYNFTEPTHENIYYLYKIVNQTKNKMEMVSIYCDSKRLELQSKINYNSFNVDEIILFNNYEEKYGHFIDYFIEKFCKN